MDGEEKRTQETINTTETMAATISDANASLDSAVSTVGNGQDGTTNLDILNWNKANEKDAGGAESDSGDSLYSAGASTVIESTLSHQSEDSLYAMAASIISDASSEGASSTMVFKRGDGRGRGSVFVLLDSGSPYSLVARTVVERFGHGPPWRDDNLPFVKGFAGQRKLPLGYVWLEFRIDDSKKLFRTKFFVVEDSDISSSKGRRDFDALLGIKACHRVTGHNAIDAGQQQDSHSPE